MKQKIFSLLVLLMTVVTASAQAPAFKLTVGTTNAQGSFAFTVNNSDATPDVNGVIAVNEGDQITVKITANTGWSVNEPSGVWYSTLEAAHARTRGAGSGSESIEVLGDITLSPVANTENTWSFTMMRANAEISCTYKKLLSNTEITIDDIADLTYTGEAQTPAVTVKDNGTELTLWSDQAQTGDYTVTYSNNLNAALSTAQSAPTVTVTAVSTSEKYAGSATKTFTISPAELTAVTLVETNLVFNQQEQAAVVQSVTAGTLPVPADGYDLTDNKATNVGNYTAKVTGKGNFTGELDAPFSIVTANANLFTITLNPTKFVYDGTAKKPAVTVKDGETVLEVDKDYTLAFKNNVNAGTATVTATGKGNYSGTQTATFTISKANGNVLFSPYRFTKTFGDPDFIIRPSVTGDGTLKYESNKETVATVNSTTGKVSIKGIGTVRITAKLSATSNYTSASDWYEVTVNPKQTTITIGANEMATYCGTDPIDFTGNEDLKAYTVIGCNYGSNRIWLSRVYDVPAKTPIVIKGKEGSYTLDCATSSDSYFKNKLVGNLSGSTIQVNETDQDADGEVLRNLYLKEGEFKKVNVYANIASGKAYLQLPASAPAVKAGSAKSIQLSSTGKSTLCSDVDLDFSGFEDNLKAYVVTGYDMGTKTFWLNRVLEASACTPLFLVGTANATYSIPSKGIQTAFENMLVGNLSGSTIQVVETSEDGALRNLYLKDGTFKKVKNYANIANGKCYLQAPSDIVAAMARGMEDPDFNLIVNDELMSMSFSDLDEDENATGIISTTNYTNSVDAWYSLDGRKLNCKPTRSGVYVNNGRKVVLK